MIKQVKEMNDIELKAYRMGLLEQRNIIRENQKEFIEAYRNYRELGYEADKINNNLSRVQKEFQNRCVHENATVLSTYSDDYEGRTYCKIKCPDCEKEWEDRVYCGKLPYKKDKNFERDNTRYA